MNSSAIPSAACRSASRLTICAFTETSSAETASSQMIRSGSGASARAMPMRWRCPPENSCGWRRIASRGSCTLSSRAATRSVELGAVGGEAEIDDRLGQHVAHALARVEAAERVLEHHLDAPPQWSQLAGGQVVDALAVEPHLARGGRIRRRMVLPTVDLPQPDSPTSDSVSPRAIAKLTPSTA